MLKQSAAPFPEGLTDRLERGHQTDGPDHAALAELLGLKIVLHHCTSSSSVTEVIGPNEGREVHLRLSMRADGEGVTQGHFDVLIPRKVHTTTGSNDSNNMLSVTHAITLQGPELAGALLAGFKDVENRRLSFEGTWTAVHIGLASYPNSKEVLHLAPGLDMSTLEKGHICGLIYVSHSMKLQAYLDQVHCTCDLKTGGHQQDCTASPWVLGPILNQVSRAVVLHTPVPAKGNVGRWSMTAKVMEAVRGQLRSGAFTLRTFDQPSIRPWPLPWMDPGASRRPSQEDWCGVYIPLTQTKKKQTGRRPLFACPWSFRPGRAGGATPPRLSGGIKAHTNNLDSQCFQERENPQQRDIRGDVCRVARVNMKKGTQTGVFVRV